MSRQRGGSILDAFRGLTDKDSKVKTLIDQLNEGKDRPNHFLGKNKDKTKNIIARVEPEGIRYIEKSVEESKFDKPAIIAELDASKLYMYESWFRFQLDAINEVVSWWCKEPAPAGDATNGGDDDKDKKKKRDKKKAEEPKSGMVEKEYAFSCRKTLQMKQLVYYYMEELQKKMGTSVRSRSASVAVGGPPRPVALEKPKEQSESTSEPKTETKEEAEAAPAEKKPKREKREFTRNKAEAKEEAPKEAETPEAKPEEPAKDEEPAPTSGAAPAEPAAPKKKKTAKKSAGKKSGAKKSAKKSAAAKKAEN